MEKQKNKRITEYIVTALIIICFALIGMELLTNINDIIKIDF